MAGYSATTWRAIRPKVDPARLPLRIDLAPQRGRMLILLIAGLAWVGVPVWIFSDVFEQMRADGASDTFYWFALALSAMGILLVLQALLGLMTRRIASIDKDFVTVSGRSLFSREQWREPLDNYRGIAHREGRISRKNHTATYQIVELVHSDPAKTILLDVIRGTDVPHQRSEAFARALHVPLAEEGGAALRPVAALDKSVREQLRDRTLVSTYDPSKPVPAGLAVERRRGSAGDAIVVTITRRRIPGWVVIMFIVVPLLIAVGSTAQQGLSVGLVFALIFIGAAVWFRRYDGDHPRRLEITRQEIVLHDALNPKGAGGARTAIAHDEIEQIYVSGSRGASLIIAGDNKTLRTGSGLSADALTWLKDYLIAAVANA